MDISNFPIIPHESAGVDCSGCIDFQESGTSFVLVCNECGATVGTINARILADLMRRAANFPHGAPLEEKPPGE
jgi:hypothetical protein